MNFFNPSSISNSGVSTGFGVGAFFFFSGVFVLLLLAAVFFFAFAFGFLAAAFGVALLFLDFDFERVGIVEFKRCFTSKLNLCGIFCKRLLPSYRAWVYLCVSWPLSPLSTLEFPRAVSLLRVLNFVYVAWRRKLSGTV